jgi:hypothetical protein
VEKVVEKPVENVKNVLTNIRKYSLKPATMEIQGDT